MITTDSKWKAVEPLYIRLGLWRDDRDLLIKQSFAGRVTPQKERAIDAAVQRLGEIGYFSGKEPVFSLSGLVDKGAFPGIRIPVAIRNFSEHFKFFEDVRTATVADIQNLSELIKGGKRGIDNFGDSSCQTLQAVLSVARLASIKRFPLSAVAPRDVFAPASDRLTFRDVRMLRQMGHTPREIAAFQKTPYRERNPRAVGVAVHLQAFRALVPRA